MWLYSRCRINCVCNAEDTVHRKPAMIHRNRPADSVLAAPHETGLRHSMMPTLGNAMAVGWRDRASLQDLAPLRGEIATCDGRLTIRIRFQCMRHCDQARDPITVMIAIRVWQSAGRHE